MIKELKILVLLIGLFLVVYVNSFIIYQQLIISLLFLLAYYYSKKSENILITIFLILNSISHIIGGIFIYYNQDKYTYSGWNAVKSFNFSTNNYFEIYYKYFVIIFSILLTTNIFKTFLKSKNFQFQTNLPIIYKRSQLTNKYNIYLFLALLGSVIISILMFKLKTGIIGIENVKLPFKLNGILFYLRNYILPILIFYFFSRSSKSFKSQIIIVISSLIIGIFSLSKGVTFSYLLPIIFYLFKNLNILRFASITIIIIFSYISTIISRGILYNNINLNIISHINNYLIELTLYLKKFDYTLTLEIISVLSNRIYGVQDIILGNQYLLDNPIYDFFNHIKLGELIPDIAFNLFGLVFEKGSGFGVNIGLMGKMIILYNSSKIVFVLSVIFHSILFLVADVLLKNIYNNTNIKYKYLYFFTALITGFIFVEGTLKMIYIIIFLFYILNIKYVNKKIKNILK